MGLDQTFYLENSYESKELLYYRKFPELHKAIEKIKGEPVGNCVIVPLTPEELTEVLDFFLSNPEVYWGWDEERMGYYYAIGVISYYIFKDKPLYYEGSW